MIGSDGLPHDRHPHPRLWGAFPRVFARYWRERQLFTLEQAVHKMTGLSARNFQLHRRGLLRAGASPTSSSSTPRACATAPPTSSRSSVSEGIAAVFVNGVPSYRGDVPATTGRAGRLLERTSDTTA